MFLQENSYLFQEMFLIFQMRKMSGFRDHSGFNGRIQLLVFLCDKRSGSFFFSGNNIDACIGRFYGIINADIQVFANVAGIQILGVGTTLVSGFIIGVYQCICYMEGIVEQLFHKQTADGFAGSYHMIDQSSENRKLDKILKELVVFTRCLLQGTEAWWIDQHDLAEMVGIVTVSHDRKRT